MSRESLVFLFGLLVFVAPLIGVPPHLKDYTYIVVGVFLALIGLSLRRSAYYRRIDRGNGEYGADSFVESSGQASLLDQVSEETEVEKQI